MNFQLYKSYELKIFFNSKIKKFKKNFEKKLINWFNTLSKNKKQMSLFLYKTLLNQFFKNFAEKLYVNIFQQIQMLEEKSNLFNFMSKTHKKNLLFNNSFKFVKEKQKQSFYLNLCHFGSAFPVPILKEKQNNFQLDKQQKTVKTTKISLVVKNSPFLEFLLFNTKDWILLECYFFYNLRFLFSSRSQHFETLFYLLEKRSFSSYSLFLYNFICNIFRKNTLKIFYFNDDYEKSIIFFKDKQFFKNSLGLFFIYFLYEEQRSITNYLIVIHNNLNRTNDCVNIIKNKFNKSLYFFAKFETYHSFNNSLIKKRKLMNWLSTHFSTCFFYQTTTLLLFLNNTNITKYFINFFTTYYSLSIEKIYSFLQYREKNLTFNLLNLNFKNEQFFIFDKNVIFFFTEQKQKLNIFLNVLKKYYDNSHLEVKNTKIIHSCFTLFNKRPGFEFKGFYFVQKIFFNFKIKKRTSINYYNTLKLLPLWNFQVNRFEKKVNIWKTHIFPAIQYLLIYLKNLKKIVNKAKTDSQTILIKKLKSQITQWCYYYNIFPNMKTLQICDYLLSKWLWRWACRRHSNKSHYWIRNKYYFCKKIGKQLKWKFCFFNKTMNSFECLPTHTKIKRVYSKKVNLSFFLYAEKWKSCYVKT